jgi:acetyl esterase
MAGVLAHKLMLRTLLSLPAPVLRGLSGGAVVYRGGRTLDPRLQFIGEAAARRPLLSTLPPVEARRVYDEAIALLQGPPPKGVQIGAVTLPGGDGERPARLYRPADPDPATPVMVFAHQGGGVVGGLDSDHGFCGLLADVLRGPVVSVDYRLAPEHRFPAGLDDVLAAYRWCRDNAGQLGAPAGRAMIGGASMGGGFAAAATHRLKQSGEPQPDLQLLIYPAVDLANEAPSIALYGDSAFLASELMAWFLAQYVGADLDPADPRLSPLRETDFAGLAPAIVALAGFDPLVDQGEAYARRLRESGTPVTFRCYDSLSHGFTAFTGMVPAAEAACREVAALARRALGVEATKVVHPGSG